MALSEANHLCFFEGDESAITGLYFHIEDQTFEFYMPMKMKDDPLWINVTELMQKGAASVFSTLMTKLDAKEKMADYLERLNTLDQIKLIEIHDEKITGQDKIIDTVVEIFNIVNSGGKNSQKVILPLLRYVPHGQKHGRK